MVNRQKIITMTKLAFYDKHGGAADRAANDYFRHDYIYRKNLSTRISVGIAGLMLLAIYWLRIIFVEEIDIFEINIQQNAFESILFVVALVAVYSLIGTVQGTREYYLVQKRLQQYQGMLRFLENTEKPAQTAVNEEPPKEEETEKRPRYGTRSEEVRKAREARQERQATEREQRAAARPEKPDPLANVTIRAMAGSRPRTPITRKPPPVVRPLTSPKDSPLIRKQSEDN